MSEKLDKHNRTVLKDLYMRRLEALEETDPLEGPFEEISVLLSQHSIAMTLGSRLHIDSGEEIDERINHIKAIRKRLRELVR